MNDRADPRAALALPGVGAAGAGAGAAAGPLEQRQPPGLTVVWWLLATLTAVEGAHELLGLGASHALFGRDIRDLVLVASALLCFGRAWWEPGLRAAWACFGMGLVCWAAGNITWDLAYAGHATAPYPSVADALWLAWYPWTAVGLTHLVRARVERFELHRWMDGLAVVLVVLTAALALVLEPAADRIHGGFWATVVGFSYPILDVLLTGAILGVYGLLGWRPGRAWLVLGLGCAVMALGDAAFSIHATRGTPLSGDWGFLWTAGALLTALAAWSRPPAPAREQELYGWRAIALPLTAQLLAAAIQVYGLFHELGPSERIVTLVVLLIATVQIVVGRPARPARAARDQEEEESSSAPTASTSSA